MNWDHLDELLKVGKAGEAAADQTTATKILASAKALGHKSTISNSVYGALIGDEA